MKITPGESVGRYHILEALGEGGMATVYKAYDTRLEREVAIKFLRTELFGPALLEQLFKRFEREAKALARLSHFHIVKIYDYGDYEDTPYLVMEYVPGGTLKSRMGKPMAWQDAVALILPVAEGLEYAHQRGVLHRDVKPSNILITESGQPLLSDFGIAKILESEETQAITTTGIGIGTPEYMAPEQCLGLGVDGRSDVYALAVVLYEMITGHKPYTADTPAAVLIKQIHDPLPSPKDYVTDLPVSVENMLVKALAKQPEYRYATMADFMRAMMALLKPPAAEQPAERTVLVAPAPKLEQPPAPPTSPPAAGEPEKEEILPPAKAAAEARPGAAAPAEKPARAHKSPFVWILPALVVIAIVIAAVFVLANLRRSDNFILFTSNRSGSDQIYRMSFDGEIEPLIKSLSVGISCCPVPDPRGFIYFVAGKAGSRDIYRADRKGNASQVPTDPNGEGGENFDPVVDKYRNLYFTSDRSGKNEIYQMDPHGTVTQITHTPAPYESWDPAVDWRGNLLFTSNRSGSREIYRMDVNENVATIRVTNTNPGESWSPIIGPSGYLFFVSTRSGNKEIYSMDSTGQITQMTHTPAPYGSWDPALDKSGRLMFTSDRDGLEEIYSIGPDGNTVRVTTTSGSGKSWGAIFSP